VSALAWAQAMPEAGVAAVTSAEKNHVNEVFRRNFPDDRADFSHDPRYYPRKPVVDVNEWLAAHRAKLRSLERAAGLR
jgi:hypothetical protein